MLFGNDGRTYYKGCCQYYTDINHEWRNHLGTTIMTLGCFGQLTITSRIRARFETVPSTIRDLLVIRFEYTNPGDVNTATIIVLLTLLPFFIETLLMMKSLIYMTLKSLKMIMQEE